MDRAGEWSEKLNKLRHQTTDDLAEMAEDGKDAARRATDRVRNEFA